MRQELLTNLNGVTRELLGRRALESAAVVAAAGGYCGAVLQLAWWMADRSLAASIAICLALGIVGIGVLAVRILCDALRLDVAQTILIGFGAVLCAIGGAVAVLLGAAELSHWTVSAGLIAAGALLGAIAAIVRGVTPLQAAVYLDVRGRLDERVSTAVELALSDEPTGACGESLCREASILIASRQVRKLPTWKRTRVTLGGLALAMSLCATLAFLPARPSVDLIGCDNLKDLSESLARMSPEAIRKAAASLRAMARRGDLPASLRAVIAQAEVSARRGDKAALSEALDRLDKELRASGGPGLDEIASDILAAFGAGGGAAGGSNDGSNDIGASIGKAAIADDPDAGITTTIYDPLYADVLASRKSPSSGDHNSQADGDNAPLDSSWDAARRRAGDALASGQVPPEYRNIVLRFFNTGR